MTGYKLLVTAIALSLTPAFAANSADSTSSASQPSRFCVLCFCHTKRTVSFWSDKERSRCCICFNKFYRNKQYQPRLVLLSHRFLWTLQSSSITLFGELDGGVTIEKLRGKDTTVKMSSGNWYWTSWGIKGVEDLGGGNAAIFTLQQAFKLDNGEGVGGGAFNNQAFLGLQGGWGRLTFGHQAGLSSGDGDYSMPRRQRPLVQVLPPSVT